jgi:hypothetical protein
VEPGDQREHGARNGEASISGKKHNAAFEADIEKYPYEDRATTLAGIHTFYIRRVCSVVMANFARNAGFTSWVLLNVK